jgi:hypothetical protein
VYTLNKDNHLVRIWTTDNICQHLSKYIPWPEEVIIKWHGAYWQNDSGLRHMKQAKQDIKRVVDRNEMFGHGRNLKFPNTVNFT